LKKVKVHQSELLRTLFRRGCH